MKRYRSWGGYPEAAHDALLPMRWRDRPPDLEDRHHGLLARGMGRSYGDVCLNTEGALIDMRPLDRFIHFDDQAGILRCEACVTFAEILELIVPRGWFVPVSPGTKFVTVGGAIANDVHGKNHHLEGTFGSHVRCMEVLRSDGSREVCGPASLNSRAPGLFEATVAGLGLTGLILWAEFDLIPIPGPKIDYEARRFRSIEEFVELSLGCDAADPYSAGWIDGLSRGAKLGRGVFLSGRHARGDGVWKGAGASPLRLPADMPAALLNPLSVGLFNHAYLAAQKRKEKRCIGGFDAFFYPLDLLHNWNRAYGRRGFLQYQCVVPYDDGQRAIRAILERLAASRRAYFTVGKVFGDRPSPGLLSFPRKGITLAVDLPNAGRRVFDALDEVDAMVVQAGGAVYPAKDARMSPATFRASFPRLPEFEAWIDPRFSSSLWRRVMADSRKAGAGQQRRDGSKSAESAETAAVVHGALESRP